VRGERTGIVRKNAERKRDRIPKSEWKRLDGYRNGRDVGEGQLATKENRAQEKDILDGPRETKSIR